MITSYDLVVVMPVGPNSDFNFIKDTLDSVDYYIRCLYKIIFIDDSHQGIGKRLAVDFPQADVLCTPKPMGGWAGLYISLANAFSYALDHYQFKALLKVDSDALIIAPDSETVAFNFFSAHPNIGLAGQYPKDYEGKPWDVNWPRDRVLNGATTWRYIKRPVANWYLRKLYLRALQHGYRAGESVFGGAYFMNPLCLQKLKEAGLLPHTRLKTLNIGEDHIFSLLSKAIGFELGDLSSGSLPFACAWKGLPASPEELSKSGKKIIHSTRFCGAMDESAIRAWFKSKRSIPVVN